MGFPSERRLHPRYPRRLEVRFWRPSESQPHSGFTTNVSRTGIFLGTGHLLNPGERVRIELLDPERGFMVEGRVVRIHRVALALRHVDQPGVGVRFLLPEELLSDLVPAARGVGAPLRAGTAVSLQEAEPGEPEEPEPMTVVAPPARPAQPQQQPPAPKPEASGPRAVPPVVEGAAVRAVPPRVVPVDFADRSTFLSVYHRDLATGGLFISIPDPAPLQEIVVIELTTPLAKAPALRFEARVVHRFEPHAAVGSGRNLLSGMGVQFLDPDGVKTALAPILAELRK